MTTDIFIIGHEDEEGCKVTFINRRLSSGEKQALVQKLAEISPPRGTTDTSVVADELGDVIDQGDQTLIRPRKARVFIEHTGHKGQGLQLVLKNQEAYVHTKGYGPPIETKTMIGIRHS